MGAGSVARFCNPASGRLVVVGDMDRWEPEEFRRNLGGVGDFSPVARIWAYESLLSTGRELVYSFGSSISCSAASTTIGISGIVGIVQASDSASSSSYPSMLSSYLRGALDGVDG